MNLAPQSLESFFPSVFINHTLVFFIALTPRKKKKMQNPDPNQSTRPLSISLVSDLHGRCVKTPQIASHISDLVVRPFNNLSGIYALPSMIGYDD
jgi:hypothetical protein